MTLCFQWTQLKLLRERGGSAVIPARRRCIAGITQSVDITSEIERPCFVAAQCTLSRNINRALQSGGSLLDSPCKCVGRSQVRKDTGRHPVAPTFRQCVGLLEQGDRFQEPTPKIVRRAQWRSDLENQHWHIRCT